jgi:hypothetical protein
MVLHNRRHCVFIINAAKVVWSNSLCVLRESFGEDVYTLCEQKVDFWILTL